MNPFSTDQQGTRGDGEQIAGDRRSDRRYEINLDLRWRLIRRRRVLDTGTGITLDLSSGGILLQTDRPLPSGGNVELSISWPVLLHNVSPMQLVVTGRVVRATGGRAAVRMTQHEFRTVRAGSDGRAAMAVTTNGSPALSYAFNSRKFQ